VHGQGKANVSHISERPSSATKPTALGCDATGAIIRLCVRRVPRAKSLRRALGLSQGEFVTRYHIPVGTLHHIPVGTLRD